MIFTQEFNHLIHLADAEKKKKLIYWDKRYYELKKLCDKYRSRNGSYDCIVPGSGGKDSFVPKSLSPSSSSIKPGPRVANSKSMPGYNLV